MIEFIFIILLIGVIVYLVINRKECFTNEVDIDAYLKRIENMEDFYEFCEFRLGTKCFKELDIDNETKVSVINEYLRGVEKLKSFAFFNDIQTTQSPLFGYYSKYNPDDIHECFR